MQHETVMLNKFTSGQNSEYFVLFLEQNHIFMPQY